jgi:hypothetical protein
MALGALAEAQPATLAFPRVDIGRLGLDPSPPQGSGQGFG